MAGEEQSASGWGALLEDLVRNFLLLRDVFGYLLPGGVFLLIGVITGRIPVMDWWTRYHPRVWAAAAIVVALAYVTGQVLAAIFYLVHAWTYPIVAKVFHLFGKRRATRPDPGELKAEEVYYRALYPQLFTEHDRRETLALLGAALAMSLLLGIATFYWLKLPLVSMIVIGGILEFIHAWQAAGHVVKARNAVLKAADAKAANERPVIPPDLFL